MKQWLGILLAMIFLMSMPLGVSAADTEEEYLEASQMIVAGFSEYATNELIEGQPVFLSVYVVYTNGKQELLNEDEYSVYSDDSYVISVKSNNALLAEQKGSADITISGEYGTRTSGLPSITLSFRVTGRADSFLVLDSDFYMAIGDTRTIQTQFLSDGQVTKNSLPLSYSSNNKSVCEITNGVVKAVGGGEAVVTISSNGVPSQNIHVYVTTGLTTAFLTPTQKTDGLVVRWKEVEGATGYRLERKNKSGYDVLVDDLNVTTYTDNDVAEEKTYTYRISYYGKMSNGMYGWSDTKEKSIRYKPGLKTPKIVSAKKIREGGAKKVKIKWKSVTDATKIVVQIKKAGASSYKTIGTTSNASSGVSIPYSSQFFSKGKNSIRIYTYKTVSGKKVKSKMSNVMKVKY